MGKLSSSSAGAAAAPLILPSLLSRKRAPKEKTEIENEQQILLRGRRGLTSTIATSSRGLNYSEGTQVLPGAGNLRHKSFLGE